MPDQGHGAESPEPHNVQEVVAYAQAHIHDDRVIGRALRRVARKGTAGQIAGFTAALVDLLREDPPKPG